MAYLYSRFCLGQEVTIDNEMAGKVVEVVFLDREGPIVKVSWWHNGSNHVDAFREWRLCPK